MKPISLQLYTVREDAAQDFAGVLRTVANIGYKGVEMSDLHGHDPNEIAKLISDFGMQVSGSHVAMPTQANVQEIVDTHKILGCTRIISGFGPDQFTTLDGCKQAAEQFNKAEEILKPHGMSFGFHNHWFEFNIIDEKYAYDILIEECPECFSELDIYWTAYGGANPTEILSKYKTRIPLLHIKDGLLIKDEHVMTAVGSGVVDIPTIIQAADPDVLEWLVVELDACKTDMLEAVHQSYEYLTSNNLAAGNK